MNSSFSQKINDDQIKEILKCFNKFLKKSNNKLIAYFFKTKNYTISIYKNKTILIQGKNYDSVLNVLFFPKLKKEDINSEKNIVLNDKSKNENIVNSLDPIGSDESGNGDYFGGICVCACYIEKDNIEQVEKLGVNDSKLLTDFYMQKIYDQLINLCQYELVVIEPNEYNLLYDQYQNVNTIKTYCHVSAINKLLQKTGLKQIIIDDFCGYNSFYKHLNTIQKTINFKPILETKAESKYLQVACASIIARVNFIKQIKQIEQKYNLKLPFGSSDKTIPFVAFKAIENKVNLKNIAKIHFKTTNEIKKSIKNK